MACCGSDHEVCNAFNLFEHLKGIDPVQKAEVQRVHQVLQAYLTSQEEDKDEGELDALKSLKLPLPKHLFTEIIFPNQRLLASITLLYWTTTLSILTPPQKVELGNTLKMIPRFGDPTPQFTGEEVDGDGSKLGKSQAEALMRVGGLVLRNFLRNDVFLMWQELGEAGGHLWEVEELLN